jgi:hypothetical protein
MRTIIFLLVVYFVKFIIKELSKPEVSKEDELINAIPNKDPIKYYSNGIELPYPFHIEYKIMMNTMANSWIYKEEYQECFSTTYSMNLIAFLDNYGNIVENMINDYYFLEESATFESVCTLIMAMLGQYLCYNQSIMSMTGLGIDYAYFMGRLSHFAFWKHFTSGEIDSAPQEDSSKGLDQEDNTDNTDNNHQSNTIAPRSIIDTFEFTLTPNRGSTKHDSSSHMSPSKKCLNNEKVLMNNNNFILIFTYIGC